jgi:hypothetical protein
MPPVAASASAPAAGTTDPADPAPTAPVTADAGGEPADEVPAITPAGPGARRHGTERKAAKDAHDLRKVDRRD